ncbi:MAG: 3-hydroxyacyl-CoA dehydrogenase NAD-binding domain-containing protein [Promethearchaeota archaeon]
MEVKNITVVGSGFMGSGIAYVASMANYNVIINDMSQQFINKGLKQIKNDILIGIDKGKLSPKEGKTILQRVKGEVELETALKDADLVIEAVFEKMELKKELFAKFCNHVPEHAILASNTSTLSITEIASVTDRPEKVVGMHFFSPVAAMKLLEIVKGEKTSEETIAAAKEVGEKVGKTTVIAKDGPGFIVNRILVPIGNDVIRMFEERVANMETIDKLAMESGLFPLGSFALFDFVGLDVAYHSAIGVSSKLGPLYEPADLLEKTVKAGNYGNKTGSGLLDQDEQFQMSRPAEYISNRNLAVIINEACKCHGDENIASIEDINLGMKLGANWSKGPFEIGKEFGFQKAINVLEELQKEHESRSEFYAPSETLRRLAQS